MMGERHADTRPTDARLIMAANALISHADRKRQTKGWQQAADKWRSDFGAWLDEEMGTRDVSPIATFTPSLADRLRRWVRG